MSTEFQINGEEEFYKISNVEVNIVQKDIVCPLYIVDVNNVLFHRPYNWLISKVEKDDEEPVMYFLIDLDEATLCFGHWIFEIAFFIPIYLQMCLDFPDKKIFLWQRHCRKFKNLFYDYLKVEKSLIYTSEHLPKKSTVVIHPQIGSAHSHKPPSDLYLKLFRHFVSLFEITDSQNNTFLLMPRQKMENYASNDRQYNWDRLMECAKFDNVKILNTDQINSLEEQMREIEQSKIIILPDGSALTVNGVFFCRNKDIYVIDDTMSLRQAELYCRMRMALDMIRENNRLTYISQDDMIRKIRERV